MNVTVPVGMPDDAVTVAVNVTESPTVEGLGGRREQSRRRIVARVVERSGVQVRWGRVGDADPAPDDHLRARPHRRVDCRAEAPPTVLVCGQVSVTGSYAPSRVEGEGRAAAPDDHLRARPHRLCGRGAQRALVGLEVGVHVPATGS